MATNSTQTAAKAAKAAAKAKADEAEAAKAKAKANALTEAPPALGLIATTNFRLKSGKSFKPGDTVAGATEAELKHLRKHGGLEG